LRRDHLILRDCWSDVGVWQRIAHRLDCIESLADGAISVGVKMRVDASPSQSD
jgi:hypothetical protein